MVPIGLMAPVDFNPGPSGTNYHLPREEQPPKRVAGQALASTSGGEPQLQLRPPKRRRLEPDEPDTAPQRRAPWPANARTGAGGDRRDEVAPRPPATQSRSMRDDADAGSSRRTSRGFELVTEDLRLAEHELDPAAKKRLHEERELFRQQLSASSRLAQTHNAGLCVSMARDNVLAHRMGGTALALPFLEGRVHPQSNAQWLDKYLQMIANAGRSRNLPPRDLDRCVDLAAQYLYKTEWFDGTSLKQLAHVANKLSKHSNQPTCMQAVAWIAGQVEQADDLSELNGHVATMLLNAFAKNTDSARCERAVARVARHLQRDHQARQSLDARGIGLALNAFSKWVDNPDCQSMAQSFAALLAGNSRLVHTMDEQSIVNTLNALSKWPQAEACAAAAATLACRLADERGLRNALKPQEVGDALNALSKWPDTPVCATATSALASRLADERGLRNALDNRGVVNALNALCKWPGIPVCADAVGALASRLADERGLRNALDPQGLTNALNALCKWPGTPVCAAAASALASRLADERGLCNALNLQGLSNALNALCKWPDTPVCAAAASALASRLADERGLCNALGPQHVATALNALCKWPDTPVCAAAANALASRLAQERGLCNALGPQHVANALNAFGKWSDTPVCAAAASALASRLAEERGLRNALNPREMGTALNALSKWPDTPVCATATSALASRLADERGLRNALDNRGVVNALNALCKWPGIPVCADAACALASRLADDHDLCNAFNPQEIGNALSALSKWPDTPVCAAAADALASRLVDDRDLRDTLGPQDIAKALNALCKWPETPVCEAAADALASRLADERDVRDALDTRHMANAMNALSKWPETPGCATAARALASRLTEDHGLRSTLNPLDVAHLLNALGKWPDTSICAAAASALASRLANERRLCAALDPQGVGNALNALSKWPDTPGCTAAASALASRLADDPGLREDLSPQGVANVLNALSKWSDTPVCAAAVSALASRLASERGLCHALDPQCVDNTLNALSKWPDTPVCEAAASALASRLADDHDLCTALGSQGVATVLNALSKWPENANCAKATDALAGRLAADLDLRQSLKAHQMAVSLNALSKSLDEGGACEQASLRLAERTGSAGLPWQQFGMRELALLGNAMSRLLRVDAEAFQAMGSAKLQAIAGHLELHRERFESASALDIGQLFKAFSSAQLQRQMRPLAQPALERVAALVRSDGLRETNLEGLGNLCMGMVPLIRSPELTPRHRIRALGVFDALQPTVARKIDLYLNTGGGAPASAPADQYATRCPALTFFQVLKAYAIVSRQWKPRNIEGPREELRQRREQLAKWVDETLDRTRAAIEADLGEMSWNLIAQIEAGDQVFDALDLRMAKEAPRITQAHPPSQFDLGAGRTSMRSAPGQPVAPAAGTGSTTHVVVDLHGKEVSSNAADTDKPYSLFTRLTGMPLVEVQLPGSISTFMLARTLTYQNEPWRFDMFGGSRATRGSSSRPVHLLSGASAPPSLLPAIRYADTAPGSSMMALVAKLAPQREDWSRMQRSLLEMVPSDHVVEGTLRMGFFDDVSGPSHPFKPASSDGRPLALCPNDGCGFLKLEVALRIPAFRQHFSAWNAVQAGEASPAQKEILTKDKGPSRLAPQALQHFPRDEAALQEAHEALERRLQALPPELSQLALFELATSGGYEGQRIRAVPSADDKVHLPPERSRAFDAAGGPLLVGKPPYDKENLLPVSPERVATLAQGDATAEFLSRSFGIQYSYTGFDDRSSEDAEMLHSKGMLIVVPQENWPAQFADMDLACSKEDLKTLSRWTAGRDRGAVPQDMLSTGSLRLKDIVEPGRLGALPIRELRKRSMDTDGDEAFVYAGYPRLAALISREMADREVRRGEPVSFKPPKTATPAVDPDSGHYRAGRLSEIMSLQRGGQIMGAASTLAARFMAQPDPLRMAMAHNMMFGTYDGTERDLRNGLRLMLEGEAEDPQVLTGLRAQAHEAIGRAHMPEAREAAELLYAQLLRIEPGAAASADAPRLPDALAGAFPRLAQAYEAAPDAAGRIHAILDHYPVCRLSHMQFPQGQPGLVPGEPELSMRNLFTIAIKVGTDALKSDTGTALFAKIVASCEAAERAFAERVRSVPYSKATARAMHDGSFDPEQTKVLLQDMPTMAAGVMQDALHTLQQAGRIDAPPPPAERLRTVQAEDIACTAHTLRIRARRMEAGVTAMLARATSQHHGQLEGTRHQLKSRASLEEKLKQQVVLKNKTLEEAAASVNDALRYSVVMDPQDLTAGLRGVLAALDDQGHVRVKLSNTFTKHRQAFKAVNVTLRSPEGVLWEIQFHTPETFKFKEEFHDLYKRAFALQLQGATQAEQRGVQAPAQEAFSRVATPPGCEDIDDWDERSDK
ncbi:XopAD/skwp family type III secretion system effector [Sphingomonas sp. NCPPB 2930]